MKLKQHKNLCETMHSEHSIQLPAILAFWKYTMKSFKSLNNKYTGRELITLIPPSFRGEDWLRDYT